MNGNDSVRVCCDIIVIKEEKVLVGKRGKVFGEGTWAFPGGHLEMNERLDECVTRELGEEIGIRPIEMKLLGVVNDIPNIKGQAKHYIRFVYVVSNFSGEIENKEPEKCMGWEWFDINNLPKPFFVGHVKVLDFYKNNKNNFFYE